MISVCPAVIGWVGMQSIVYPMSKGPNHWRKPYSWFNGKCRLQSAKFDVLSLSAPLPYPTTKEPWFACLASLMQNPNGDVTIWHSATCAIDLNTHTILLVGLLLWITVFLVGWDYCLFFCACKAFRFSQFEMVDDVPLSCNVWMLWSCHMFQTELFFLLVVTNVCRNNGTPSMHKMSKLWKLKLPGFLKKKYGLRLKTMV
jgi:hypothetical protein